LQSQALRIKIFGKMNLKWRDQLGFAIRPWGKKNGGTKNQKQKNWLDFRNSHYGKKLCVTRNWKQRYQPGYTKRL
jgi:hypothetical protein